MKYNNELLKCTYIINLNLISRGIPYELALNTTTVMSSFFRIMIYPKRFDIHQKTLW